MNYKIKIYSVSDSVIFKNITIKDVYVDGKKVEDVNGFDLCIDERTENLKLFE